MNVGGIYSSLLSVFCYFPAGSEYNVRNEVAVDNTILFARLFINKRRATHKRTIFEQNCFYIIYMYE